DSFTVSVLLAAGLIGQDFSSGTLQLLLARPVTRSSYVLSRWAGATLVASAVVLVELLLATLGMSAHGAPPPLQDALQYLGDNVLVAAGTVAVVTLASSLSTGFGDLALLLAAWMTRGLLAWIGRLREWPGMVSAGEELERFLAPRLDVMSLVHGQPSWFALASYLSTVVLCLVLAIV